MNGSVCLRERGRGPWVSTEWRRKVDSEERVISTERWSESSKYGSSRREASPVFSNVVLFIQDRQLNLYIFFENPCPRVVVWKGWKSIKESTIRPFSFDLFCSRLNEPFLLSLQRRECVLHIRIPVDPSWIHEVQRGLTYRDATRTVTDLFGEKQPFLRLKGWIWFLARVWRDYLVGVLDSSW